MAITVAGIQVTNISIEPKKDGKEKISGRYDLLSNVGTIIAKQGFNGYSDLEITFSRQTLEAFIAFTTGVKQDIEKTLGITEEVK